MIVNGEDLKLYSFLPESSGYKLYSCIENPSFVEYRRTFNNGGSFKISAEDTMQNRLALQNNNLIWIESQYAGIVNYLEFSDETHPSAGGSLCEGLLKQRAIFEKMDFENAYVGDIIEDILEAMTSIPGFTINIPSSLGQQITLTVEPGNVYDVIQDLCSKYNLGFEVVLNSISSTGYANLEFRLYASRDLSESIILSPEYDDAYAFNYQNNTNDEVNFVRVLGEDNIHVDVTPDVPVTNLLLLKESVFDCTTSPKNDKTEIEYKAFLSKKGQRVIDEHKTKETYQAKINSNTFIFGVHYTLGDIVSVASQQQQISSVQQIVEVSKQFDSAGKYLTFSFGESQHNLPEVIEKLQKKTEKVSVQQPTETPSGGGGGGGTTIRVSHAILIQRNSS